VHPAAWAAPDPRSCLSQPAGHAWWYGCSCPAWLPPPSGHPQQQPPTASPPALLGWRACQEDKGRTYLLREAKLAENLKKALSLSDTSAEGMALKHWCAGGRPPRWGGGPLGLAAPWQQHVSTGADTPLE
jgi:hypothetical protein